MIEKIKMKMGQCSIYIVIYSQWEKYNNFWLQNELYQNVF